jgi:hypothetical protein
MPSSNQPASTADAAIAQHVPTERLQFKTLILSNPNYFGTFPNLGGNVVVQKAFDTAYEQLTCLGLQPQQARLEAVVNIKQHTGYGTDACGTGSQEFVRFFVQQGASWVDLGVASFDVYNIASTSLPLSYSASVDFSAASKFCFTENIALVRAILSWSIEPPAGDPNFTPPWGNVLDTRVQVAPELFFEVPIANLVGEGLLTLNPEVQATIDVTKGLPPKTAAPLSYSQLKTQYAHTSVPGHRFGFAAALKLLNEPILSTLPTTATAVIPTPSSAATPPATLTQLTAGADLAAILAAIEAQSSDTTFEQLMCTGYNPETRELAAVVEIKLNAGYSGNLCTAGSTEYVSFFALIEGTWKNLGTGTVNVHDLAAVSPGNPLMYAVFRISNLAEMPCETLTGVPLRAILSWQVQPTGPDFVPVWGNVVNTHVQPQIGVASESEQLRLMRLGSVTVSGISDTTFLANPTGVAGDCSGCDSPFGGEIIVEGDFQPKIDVFDHVTGMVLPGAKPMIYQVWVERTDVASAPFQLANPFGIALWPPSAPFPPVIFTQTVQPAPGPVTGGVSGTLYYQYMESDLQAVNPRTLAAFEAGGLAEGDYQVQVRGWIWDTLSLSYVPIPSQSKTIHIYNGYPHTELFATPGGVVAVTEHRPQVAISLTSIPDCGSAVVGETLHGSYSVTDNFFGSVTVALVPITVGGVVQLENNPVLSNWTGASQCGPAAAQNQVFYDGSNTFGTSGTFTLETTGMTPCGYTLQITSADRALVDSHCYNHWNQIGVGFCLIAPQ